MFQNYLNRIVINWVDSLFTLILGFAAIKGAWYFKKSNALKKADDETAKANMVKEWVEVINVANSPLKDEITTLKAEMKELSAKTVELTIQVGVLTKENEHKDSIIKKKEERIRELETVVQVQGEEINRLKIRL